MKIEHVALWVQDLEAMREFYEKYFEGIANAKYHNEQRQFESYFMAFEDGSRLELMKMPGISPVPGLPDKQWRGLAHLAISCGSRERVDSLTEVLRKDGYSIVGEPRTTGDGYYESIVLDPEGNRIEITR